jgi:hypothetical protein
MTAKLVSKNRPALQGRAHQVCMNITLYGCPQCAVQPFLQSNHNMAWVGRKKQNPRKLLPPAAWKYVTGMISRETIKHKYKRPGCRVQKNDRELLCLFW